MLRVTRANNRQARRLQGREEKREEDAARKAGAYEAYVEEKQRQTVAVRRAQCAAKVAARVAMFVQHHVPRPAIRLSTWICPRWYMAFWAILYQLPAVVERYGETRHWPPLLIAGMWGAIVGALTVAAVVLYTPLAWLAEQVRHWGYHIRRDDMISKCGTKGLIRLRIRTWLWERIVDEQYEW